MTRRDVRERLTRFYAETGDRTPAHPTVCPTCGTSARVVQLGGTFTCVCGARWGADTTRKGGADCEDCNGDGIDLRRIGSPCRRCHGTGIEPDREPADDDSETDE